MITNIKHFKLILEKVEAATVEEYFQMLFKLRQIAHDLHLTKAKLAPHLALNDFYNDLLELIDTLFETYQGQYGILKDYKTTIEYDTEKTIDMLEDYTESIKEIGKKLFTDSHLLNIIDEITELCYHTLYKLKYLGYFEDTDVKEPKPKDPENEEEEEEEEEETK
jgi:hypothetical protein